jgi:nucleoid DNA-binding protein
MAAARRRNQPRRLIFARFRGFQKCLKEILTWIFALGIAHVQLRWKPPATINKTQEKLHLMNKAELVASVQKALGKETSKAQAERSVEAVIDSIKAGLKKGKPVQLVGFGTFKVASRKARMGINPKTGAKIKIKASKSVKFSAGKDLKSKL